MKNLIKKNQLMITALAIMLAIAGYLQFAGTNLDEEYLDDSGKTAEVTNTDGVITDNVVAGQYSISDIDGMLDLSEADLVASSVTEIDSLDTDGDVIAENYLDSDMVVGEAQPGEGEVPGEAVFSSSNGVALLSEAKLLKEQVRAKNKEALLQIINSDGLSEEQKQEAVNTMVQMTTIAEREAAAEILLEAKGFSDVVVSINDGAVDVVVNALTLTDAQRAQIEDIVKRKTEIGAENIIISTVVQE
ncbi:MAG: SpoIIIAH-like family protein [Lachnospiraceae bacterium]|nr:SpoIIIAH-like family protein [Lachnospiraceae bacterium]